MESLQGLIPIVHLKNQLGNSDYSTCVKTDNDGTLKALFFCHHASLKLYSAYNTIIFANSTYKTNKYKMPLFHLAGVTGNNKSFILVFCFLAKENLDYYTWALEFFNSAISSHHLSPPEIIITDWELVLMNAIKQVLPNTIHMLCTWHIEKKILTNASKIIKDPEEVK